MPLFRCSRCGCVENTALSNYWVRGNKPALCAACDPDIGEWHGAFARRSATEAGYVEDDRGFLRMSTPGPARGA